MKNLLSNHVVINILYLLSMIPWVITLAAGIMALGSPDAKDYVDKFPFNIMITSIFAYGPITVLSLLIRYFLRAKEKIEYIYIAPLSIVVVIILCSVAFQFVYKGNFSTLK